MTLAAPTPLRCGVLAYGRDARLHREAAVALLTLSAFAPAGTEVVVFTDHPELYRWLSDCVSVEVLTAAIISSWRGPADDRFRPKIETLRRLAAGGAHALLADTDTMARASLMPLAEHLDRGGFVLYEREYRIAAPPRRGDRPLRHDIVGRQWSGILATSDTWMWNGGIIGAPAQHPGVADRVLAAFDAMRQSSRHFALEQLAYSIVFPAYGPVRAASDCFVHYWANRPWFDRRIERFLSRALLEGWSAPDARDRLRARPIEGARDGRPSSWQRRVRRWLAIEMDDDVEPIE
jgi:hypothetical protein